MTVAPYNAALNKGELFASFDVDAFEVPHGRDEIWRFTPLRRLRGLHDGSAAPATSGNAEITVSEQPGVQVETVRRGDERLGQGGIPTDRVAAQAFSSFNSATLVTVGRDAQIVEPSTSASPARAKVPSPTGICRRVEELGDVVVVIDHRGSGTYADNVEFVVGDAARLTVVWIADWADDAVTSARITPGWARMRCCACRRHAGRRDSSDSANVRFSGPGGDAELLGLYFADDGQHLESRLLIDHGQPNCRSNVLYKGALQGDSSLSLPDAHTVWWATS